MKPIKLRRCWCGALIPLWRFRCWRHESELDDEEATPVAWVRR